MKVKLTKTTFEAAGATTTEHELRYTLVPSFMLRVTPAGRKTLVVQY